MYTIYIYFTSFFWNGNEWWAMVTIVNDGGNGLTAFVPSVKMVKNISAETKTSVWMLDNSAEAFYY